MSITDGSKKFDPRTAIYTPAQASSYTIKAIQNIKNQVHQGLGIYLGEQFEKYFPPVLPGQLCSIVAQSSHGKTSFMRFIEMMGAKKLMEQGREDEIFVHVSVEELVEEQIFLELAREADEDAGALARGIVLDWDKLMTASIKVGTIPIYRIGDSLARVEDWPDLYMSNMVEAIRFLRDDYLDFHPKIAAVFFDYLQAFPIEPKNRGADHDKQRRLQVRDDIYNLRRAAKMFECPVFVNVQAKQHLDGANPPIMMPGIYDGEESSAIAQRSDRILCMWMPKQTAGTNTEVKHKGGSFIVEENMVWIKVAKQKGGLPSGKTWPCRINFKSNYYSPDLLNRYGNE